MKIFFPLRSYTTNMNSYNNPALVEESLKKEINQMLVGKQFRKITLDHRDKMHWMRVKRGSTHESLSSYKIKILTAIWSQAIKAPDCSVGAIDKYQCQCWLEGGRGVARHRQSCCVMFSLHSDCSCEVSIQSRGQSPVD